MGVGRCLGSRAKVSMMIMRPPQQGHGRGSTRCSSVALAAGGSGSFAGDGMPQLARSCDVGGSVAAGKQSVVPNAMEALWQDVDEKATNELIGRERHRLVTSWPVDAIVLVPEGDAVLVGGYEPAIGDCHAVGVAREIAQHLLRPGERLSYVHHPIDLAQWL